MRDPFPYPPEESLEARVRQHLDAEARKEDGDAVVNRALARLDADAQQPVRRTPRVPSASRWRPVLAASLVAAGLVVSLMVLSHPTVQAEPLRLVEAALQASDSEVDRCYLLQVEPISSRGEPLGPPLRESHLWTRGDRYRIDLLAGEGSVGQDENRRIWVAPTRREGAYFEKDETPEKLALISDLRTLRLDLLLRELTRGFHLRWEGAPGADAHRVRRILATPRRELNWHGIQSVLLEVEPDSKNVRRLVVHRLRTTRGHVRISLTHQTSETRPDSFYHLASALNPDAPEYGRGRAILRGKVILETLRRFGPPLGG